MVLLAAVKEEEGKAFRGIVFELSLDGIEIDGVFVSLHKRCHRLYTINEAIPVSGGRLSLE